VKIKFIRNDDCSRSTCQSALIGYNTVRHHEKCHSSFLSNAPMLVELRQMVSNLSAKCTRIVREPQLRYALHRKVKTTAECKSISHVNIDQRTHSKVLLKQFEICQRSPRMKLDKCFWSCDQETVVRKSTGKSRDFQPHEQ
jgi:hypothetical protein